MEVCTAPLDVVPAGVSGLVISPSVEAGSPELLVPAATAVTTTEPSLLPSGLLVLELTVVGSLVLFSTMGNTVFSAGAVVGTSSSFCCGVQAADCNTFTRAVVGSMVVSFTLTVTVVFLVSGVEEVIDAIANRPHNSKGTYISLQCIFAEQRI